MIVANNTLRSKYYELLSERLDNKYFYVQTYASNDPRWQDTSNLRFDEGGTITVLNKHSSKGLEFDAVFIPELQSVDVASDNITGFKMEMYVMCSRARHYLALMAQNSGDEELTIFKYLPEKNENRMEYINA